MAEILKVPQDTDLGRLVREVQSLGVTFIDRLDVLARAMETRLDTGPDYSMIETDLGLQAGQGSDIYTLLVGAKNTVYGIGATDADKAYAVGKFVEMIRRLGP